MDIDKGFQLEIQKDLSEIDMKKAINFANNWISKTMSNDNLTYHLGGRSGGWHSYLRCNRFGYMNKNIAQLVFRRISTKRRVFGIVRADTMVKPDISEINLKQCMCPIHRGGERVVWRNGKPKTFVYATVGSIKG